MRYQIKDTFLLPLMSISGSLCIYSGVKFRFPYYLKRYQIQDTFVFKAMSTSDSLCIYSGVNFSFPFYLRLC